MSGLPDRRSELFASAAEARASGAEPPEPDAQLRRELALVSLLAAAGERARPDDAARERMRTRILAGLAEPDTSDSSGVSEVVTSIATARRRRSGSAGVHMRVLVAAAAALCLLVALSATSLVLARDALPGDTLYGVKRSSESAKLGLTFGDESRGFKHLQFATARVDEMEALTTRSAGDSTTADPDPYLTALRLFDTDTAAGSRLLIETAVSDDGSGHGRELAALRAWVEQQRQRLVNAQDVLPSPVVAKSADSLTLLDRIMTRAAALQVRLGCQTVTSGERDDIGMLPAGDACVPAAIGPGTSSTVPAGEGSPPQPAVTT